MRLREDAAFAAIEACDRPAAQSPGKPTTHRTKFDDPDFTVSGEPRGQVPFTALKTLWFNTGTLCNISCQGCYIESSPRNDRLAYISLGEVRSLLDEAEQLSGADLEIGFTGGEPFMNPDFLGMLEESLQRGYRALVLTNAMLPMQHRKVELLQLHRHHPGRLSLRVSLDHFQQDKHEKVRGPRTWHPALLGLRWLSMNGFDVAIAGRLMWNESEHGLRKGYASLFERGGIDVDASDPKRLVLFPEMDNSAEPPEISQACWSLLGKLPADVMCASSRMVVKRRGAPKPAIVSCTLLPYELDFEMGTSLREATRPVKLNHPNCARFCVLGGATCSPKT